jgi:dipeptidyl aminopeptidase/acylaminoacyl peptidase
MWRNIMRKLFIISIYFILTVTSPSFGHVRRPLSIDDYFALKDVSDIRISPDGKWVAYVVSNSDESKDESFTNIHMVPLGGGDPVQATFCGKDEGPRWSPDNKYLAFLSARDKKAQVYLLSRAGGEAYPLTDISQGVDNFEWSPDGKKLLLVLTDPDPNEKKGEDKAPPPYIITRLLFKSDGVGYRKDLYKHIYVFDVASKKINQITFGSYDDAGYFQNDYSSEPHWSPDGKRILFVSNRTAEPDSNVNTDLFVVSAEGGEPKKVTTHEGTDQLADWSPDGKWIVYVTMLEAEKLWFDQLKVAVISANGGQPTILTKDLDRNAWNPRFGADGRIYFLVEDTGTQRLVSMPADGGAIREATPEKIVYDYDLGPQGSIAFQALRSDLPGDVFAMIGEKEKQLTRVNDAVLRTVELGKIEPIRFASSDGTAIEGFITKPPGFNPAKKYPAILWMHGGPNQQDTDEFYFRPQFLASRGYVIIGVNYRGSAGFGKAFQQAIFGDWGNKEFDDVMAGVDYVISKGYIDTDHIGIGGHSYGAMLTNFLITKTNRFKAAITDAGESNYLMNYGVDQYFLDWEIEVGKPWGNPQRYIEMSPYFQLQNVKTPTLIVCGQEDWNVPLINSEQLYLSLRRLGVDAMLLVYPEQPHEFWRPSYVEDRYLRYAAWYDHFLKGALDKLPAKTK